MDSAKVDKVIVICPVTDREVIISGNELVTHIKCDIQGIIDNFMVFCCPECGDEHRIEI